MNESKSRGFYAKNIEFLYLLLHLLRAAGHCILLSHRKTFARTSTKCGYQDFTRLSSLTSSYLHKTYTVNLHYMVGPRTGNARWRHPQLWAQHIN